MRPALLLWTALVAVLVAGCRVVDPGKSGFRAPATENAEANLNASRELGIGILAAFRERNFQSFRKNTPGDFAARMNEKDFLTSCRNIREKFGELEEFHFLTALETPAFDQLIFVATFVRSGADVRSIRRQLLFRLVTMPVDGKVHVVSCGFV